jgi:hypothetical protein
VERNLINGLHLLEPGVSLWPRALRDMLSTSQESTDIEIFRKSSDVPPQSSNYLATRGDAG